MGVDPRVEAGRQALDDGFPQVAIYKLRQTLGRKLPKEDQHVAEMLLARALFAAERFQESASLLEKSPAPSGMPSSGLLKPMPHLTDPPRRCHSTKA